MIIETQKDVTAAVLSELQRAPDARFKEIMSAFVRHLHDFVRETKLTEEEFHAAIGYVIGRKAEVPPGTSVCIDLRGPMSHRWDVEVTDRARVVDWRKGEPTLTITMPGATFCRVVGGRRAWDHPWVRSATVVEGDHDLAAQVLANLTFMI